MAASSQVSSGKGPLFTAVFPAGPTCGWSGLSLGQARRRSAPSWPPLRLQGRLTSCLPKSEKVLVILLPNIVRASPNLKNGNWLHSNCEEMGEESSSQCDGARGV